MTTWIADHQWLVGVIVAVVIAIIGWILQVRLARKRNRGDTATGRSVQQVQRSGKNSTNIQAGRDVGDVNVDRPRAAESEERE